MNIATIRNQKDLEDVRDTSLKYGCLFFKYNPYSRQRPQAPPTLTKADKTLFTPTLSALSLEKVEFADEVLKEIFLSTYELLKTLQLLE